MTAPAALVFEDRTLPHQMLVVVSVDRSLLGVTCNCLRRDDGYYPSLIEPGHTYDPAVANAAYAAHLAEVSGP